MKYFLFLMILFNTSTGCAQNNADNKKSEKDTFIGGRCEGCEAIYESPVPFDKLKHADTLPDFYEPGPKIGISGIVYQRDGKTPAADVVLYIYHTNQSGIYPKKGNETGWGKRHGYIRGWVKTDKNGFYQFYTLKPASYPTRTDPAHIHITIKEPGKNEYYLDDYYFDEDPLLTQTNRKKLQHRGGNGILRLQLQSNGILHGTRHIVLGENIPEYSYEGLKN